MPVRVFKEEEREEIREKLLSAGFPMLKKYGMIHMSVPKIVAEAGIGTGTFYRFFDSKEEYLYHVILRQRQLMMEEVISEEVKSHTRKLTRNEVRSLLLLLIDKDKSVYANLTLREEEKLFESVKSFMPNIEKEKRISDEIINLIDSPKENIDYPVLTNLIKILVITSQAKRELHEEGYDRTVSKLINLILDELFATDIIGVE